MAWLDDRLSRDLKRLSEAIDGQGILERVARRKARRRVARRMQAAGLGGLVLAASVGGGFGLLRAFQGDPGLPKPNTSADPVPGPTLTSSVGPSPSPSPSPSGAPPSGEPEGLIAFDTTRRYPPDPNFRKMTAEEIRRWNRTGGVPGDADAPGVYLVNSDGTDPSMLPPYEAGYLLPTWSPDGERLAVYGVTFANNKLDQSIYSLRPDGGDVQHLHTIEARIGYAILDLEWSPDGSRIAWVEVDWSDRSPEAEGAGELWVMNADGSAAAPITAPDDHVYDFSWAPDGQTIVYTRQSLPSGHRFSYDLFTIGVDGSGITQLTNHGQARGVAWSPDGFQIAFLANEGTDFLEPDVYVMNADGTAITRVTSRPGPEDRPAWSPDGTRILFSHDCELATVEVASGEERTIVGPETLSWLCAGGGLAWQP